MSETARHWYYSVGGHRFGPVTSVELKGLADAGKITSTDLVWKDGLPAWVPARKVKGLIPSTPVSGPPPLPECAPPELPADPPAITPPLILGMHRQRFGVAIAAGIGMLATFLPWVHAPIVGSVAGTAGDGWITLALFVPAMVLAVRGDKARTLRSKEQLGATIPAGLAALIGLGKLASLSDSKNQIDQNNPFAKIMAVAVQPGIGLYLLILAGVALVIVAWWPARSTEHKTA